MNNFNITVELCAEDRARLDKIIEKLDLIGKHPDRSACVASVADTINRAGKVLDGAKGTEEQDKVSKALAEVLNADPPKNAQDAPEILDHPTLDPFPEQPTAKAGASEASVKEVTAAELQQLAIALCRQKKQPAIKEVLSEYGVQTVSEVLTKVSEDKRYEVYEKLKKLEG